MPRTIDGDAALAEISNVVKNCTAKHFMDSRDTKVAVGMLMECVSIIRNAQEIEPFQPVRCGECVHWGRVANQRDTDIVKQCAVGGYMINKDGFCIFGRKDAEKETYK